MGTDYAMVKQAAEYRIGSVRVRSASRELIIDSEPAKVGARAFDLLLALIERRDRIVSKSELLDIVWPGLVVEENNLQVQVLALRKLLGQQSIATVPGRGYRLVADVVTDRLDTHADRPIAVPAVDAGPLVEVLAPLFGREDDLNALEALIFAHRLVSVVGAGGIGKTTVARALARRVRGAFEDSVCTVDLEIGRAHV